MIKLRGPLYQSDVICFWEKKPFHTRDRPRFFDQVGHQTTNASIGNKHFFTK